MAENSSSEQQVPSEKLQSLSVNSEVQQDSSSSNQNSSRLNGLTLEERFKIVRSVGEECIQENELLSCPPSVFLFGEREKEMTRGGEVTDGVNVSLEDLRKKMVEFAKERDWEKYHSPRNLLLALVGEVGELSEIFQWRGEVPKGLPDWKEEDKQHLGEELSDVLLYLIQLSHYCGIDLGKAALRKVDLNAIKHPIDKYKVVSSKEKSINNKNHNNSDESA